MYIQTTQYLKVSLVICSMLFTSTSAIADMQNTQDRLTLKVAVQMAQKNDLWLVGNQHQQDSIESLSMAADTLPDPKMSLGVANIAADSFSFDQEPMSQFKVGFSQMFPRGESLAIKKQQLELIGSQFPYQRNDRKAKVAVIVSDLWLNTFEAQESIALIEKNRALFEQLADVAQASYSSAVGKTRQQDIVRAQLELTRLDDRLTMLKKQQEMSQTMLAKWLSKFQFQNQNQPEQTFDYSSNFLVARRLPNTQLSQKQLITSNTNISPNVLYQFFSNHPSVKSIDQKVKASESGIKLAKQKYKPEWGLSAAYGIRDDAPNGTGVADLFSIGVSFDLPIFTSNRQDKQVESAISKTSAIKTEKWLLIQELIAQFESSSAQLKRLNQRYELYSNRLLPQMHEQAEASLTAYTNDDGDFSEVVRSRIAELNANIDALGIKVERQKTIIQLNYFFINNPPESPPQFQDNQGDNQ